MEPAIGWTYSDYRKLPEDGVRYELFEGFLSREPAPSTTHQVIVRRLMLSLAEHLGPTRAEGLFTAPLAVVFSDNTVVQPDVIYVTPERAAVIRNDGVFGPPDLVFEVLSLAGRHGLFACDGLHALPSTALQGTKPLLVSNSRSSNL